MSDLRFGLLLMLYGMGLVFTILALLWGVIALFQRFDRRLLAEEEEETAAPRAVTATAADIPPALMAAILVALQRYREEEAVAPTRRRRPKKLEPTQARWVAVGRAYQLRSNIAPRRRRS